MKKLLIFAMLMMLVVPNLVLATGTPCTLSGSVTVSVNGSNVHDVTQVNSVHASCGTCNAAKLIVTNEPILRATSDPTGWFKHAAGEETGNVDIDIPFTRLGQAVKTVNLSCLPK